MSVSTIKHRRLYYTFMAQNSRCNSCSKSKKPRHIDTVMKIHNSLQYLLYSVKEIYQFAEHTVFLTLRSIVTVKYTTIFVEPMDFRE